MLPRRDRRINNALTRRKSQGVNVSRVLLLLLLLILGLYRFLYQRFQDSEPSSALSDIFASKKKDGSPLQQRVNFRSGLDPELPKWIQNYIAWHREMRTKYPGEELFTNPDAPNVLVRTCLGLCGGLHDRLGQLPWDLYLANQTKRVLFLRWYRPKPIEDFLIPNGFNWSMPPNLPHFSRLQEVKHEITQMFDGVDDSHPEADFWTTHLDAGIQRANSGDFKNVKILRHRILGHLNEDELERRLQALGEKDMIHATPTFGKLFFLFFHPSPAIEMELEDVYEALNIVPGKYSAVHCRVRHPKAFSKEKYGTGM